MPEPDPVQHPVRSAGGPPPDVPDAGRSPQAPDAGRSPGVPEARVPSRPPRPRPVWPLVLGALALGFVAGVLGTVLHLQLTWLGAVVLPWGALLALALVAAVELWGTLTTREPWFGAVTAVAVFSTAVVMAYWPGADLFTVDPGAIQVLPGPALAGAIWLWGIPVVSVVVLLVCQRLLASVTPLR